MSFSSTEGASLILKLSGTMTEGQKDECYLYLSQILNTVFLNDYYNQLGAKFVTFADYSMPINFSSGIIKEHQHTRFKCGLFDVSHMGQMLIPKD